MICVSIQDKDLETIFDVLDEAHVEMAEIRLDRCPQLSPEDIEELFSNSDVPLIATCRISETMPAPEAEARLITAIKAGAAYVDLEIEAPPMMSKRIRRQARESGTVLIRSYHDFETTDSKAALEALVEKCQHLGAEVVKIVTLARDPEDVKRVLSLYDRFAPETLVAFCMGEEGRQSRLECLRRGAPYTYAAYDEAVAPGQWPLEEMYQAVYGDRQPVETEPLAMPSSKSFAQRAIIAAALADGTSHLTGYTPCGDNEAALAVAKALGATVSRDEDTLTITGTAGAFFPGDSLHVGESGFLTRLMIPLAARLARGPVTFTGEKTLLRRPLTGAREMMSAFKVVLSGEQIPLTVTGKLTPGEVEVSGKYGSQLVSGLLSALPLCKEDSTLHLENPKSIPYIFITLDVLKQFGIRIDNEMEGDEEFVQTQDWGLCEAMTFRIRGGQRYKAADLRLEADWSAAAAFLVAGAIFGQVAIEGLDTRSLQADLSILDGYPGGCRRQPFPRGGKRRDPCPQGPAPRLRDGCLQLPGPVPGPGRPGCFLPGHQQDRRRRPPGEQGKRPGCGDYGHADPVRRPRLHQGGQTPGRRPFPGPALPDGDPAQGRDLSFAPRPPDGHGPENRRPRGGRPG